MSSTPVSTIPKAPAAPGAPAKASELQLTSRNSVVVRLAEKFMVTADALLATVKATLMPGKRDEPPPSNEAIVGFLLVADQYKLNPFTKQIFAFPNDRGGITPVVSIDGWIFLTQTHEQFRGFTQKVVRDDELGVGVETTMVRKDWPEPIVHTEWMKECKRNTGPWTSHPMRMLGHKSYIQTARYAFGLSGIYDEDEAERIRDAEVISIRHGASRSDALEEEMAKRAGTAAPQLPPPAAETPGQPTTGDAPQIEPPEPGTAG